MDRAPDPVRRKTCPACLGTGFAEDDPDDPTKPCPTCSGEGSLPVTGTGEP